MKAGTRADFYTKTLGPKGSFVASRMVGPSHPLRRDKCQQKVSLSLTSIAEVSSENLHQQEIGKPAIVKDAKAFPLQVSEPGTMEVIAVEEGEEEPSKEEKN